MGTNFEKLFYLVKALLEQAPFPEKYLSRNRIMLGLFLLMSIILSHGYKNDNVYNIILPGKIMRYSNLKEVVKDNVTLYVPTDYLGIMCSEYLNHVEDILKTNWTYFDQGQTLNGGLKYGSGLYFYIC
ncbi:hypothetical protein, partial [Enterococcus entomosocium]|uniref:hypothetical protein n=1 Tax=Enterococcus entomosocium TaxID=3034352 RepID=UPI002649BC5F